MFELLWNAGGPRWKGQYLLALTYYARLKDSQRK